MKIVKTDRFTKELKVILEFIAKDSKDRAIAFKDKLFKSIFSLVDMPYKCRKSIKFNDENIRDLIVSGYVIIYRIKVDIEILGIYKENEWN